MSILIEVTMKGSGRFQPGNAVVKINGEEHAELRTTESFAVEIKDPEFVTYVHTPH